MRIGHHLEAEVIDVATKPLLAHDAPRILQSSAYSLETFLAAYLGLLELWQIDAPGGRNVRGAAERSSMRREAPIKPAAGANADACAIAEAASTLARKDRENIA